VKIKLIILRTKIINNGSVVGITWKCNRGRIARVLSVNSHRKCINFTMSSVKVISTPSGWTQNRTRVYWLRTRGGSISHLTYMRYTVCLKKTGPLWLIWH